MALVLQGKQASLMHNGGAYGDGTTESGVGVEPGAACATGKHGQFPFASGRTGDSGTNRFAERGGKDEPTNCPAIGIEQTRPWVNGGDASWSKVWRDCMTSCALAAH